MQWAPFEARWQRMYQLAAAYAQRHGDLRIPHDYVTEEHVRLGSWLAHQRELYRKQALTPQRVNRLEQLGICWAPNQSRRQLPRPIIRRREDWISRRIVPRRRGCALVLGWQTRGNGIGRGH